jgi:hypothetical protein
MDTKYKPNQDSRKAQDKKEPKYYEQMGFKNEGKKK